MTKKEKFMMFVYLGAIARDLTRCTHESSSIVAVASEISGQRIPANPMNAAMVYLAYLNGAQRRPYKWMGIGPAIAR
jgi:hypothetical protein